MLSSLFESLRDALVADSPVCVATVIAIDAGFEPTADTDESATNVELGAAIVVLPDGTVSGSLGNADLDRSVRRDALGHLDSGVSAIRHYGARGEARHERLAIFIEAFVPSPRMVIFGAVDFSASLARVAKTLGYKVIVCDPRETFATTIRFPMADEVIVAWPQRYLESFGDSLGPRDAVCVLTHDPKFDVPALVGAVGTAVGYIGAMGSRRTTAARKERLREAGVEEKDLNRIMAPIGLDIGASTPEETAVSICAEIIATRSGSSSGASLSQVAGPIHPRATA
jgi:xanthine dehydrogenase accessory factor